MGTGDHPEGLQDLFGNLSYPWDFSHGEVAHELLHHLFFGLEKKLPIWFVFVGAHLRQQFV